MVVGLKGELMTSSRDFHPVVAATLKEIPTRSSNTTDFLYIGYQGGCVKMRVAPASVDRALHLLDALFKLAEKRGHKVGIATKPHISGACFEVNGETIEVELQERLAKGEGKPGGRLRIILGAHWGGQKNWDEGGRWRHESRLERLIEGVETAARHSKVIWDKHRKEEQDIQERQRLEAEAARKREVVRKRGDALRSHIENWRLAKDIRLFISEVRARFPETENPTNKIGDLTSWLDWALSYADDIDTTTHLENFGPFIPQ
jgi:hypothetical protein